LLYVFLPSTCCGAFGASKGSCMHTLMREVEKSPLVLPALSKVSVREVPAPTERHFFFTSNVRQVQVLTVAVECIVPIKYFGIAVAVYNTNMDFTSHLESRGGFHLNFQKQGSSPSIGYVRILMNLGTWPWCVRGPGR